MCRHENGERSVGHGLAVAAAVTEAVAASPVVVAIGAAVFAAHIAALAAAALRLQAVLHADADVVAEF